MKQICIAIIGLLIVLSGCMEESKVRITILLTVSHYDTLTIHELITDRIVGKFPLNKSDEEYSINIRETTLAAIRVNGLESNYLTILEPGRNKIIRIDSNAIMTVDAMADSLVNYLWKSTNQMFSIHADILFVQDNPWEVRSLFDSLIQARQELVNQNTSLLTTNELGMLHYQNSARAYSFLMYYGRMIKNYPPDNDFFNFINEIENDNAYSKTLPDNVLYKYEIQMLRENDSIDSLDSFLRFIESHTESNEVRDFLKAIYLKAVIESPSYWRKHVSLFTTDAITAALQQEAKNRYAFLVNSASQSFFSSQKGEQGYDFTAHAPDGTAVKLSDFAGKVVLLDAWATWCGPCIQQRPNMIELAEKYTNHPDVAILMVSVDTSTDRWRDYVMKTNAQNYGHDVIIPDGMNGLFGDHYLIKAIPKYILINKQGFILDSNLPEPSLAIEQVLERVSKNH
jgi:thiol-disulfide isomerase/thioredoxin